MGSKTRGETIVPAGRHDRDRGASANRRTPTHWWPTQEEIADLGEDAYRERFEAAQLPLPLAPPAAGH